MTEQQRLAFRIMYNALRVIAETPEPMAALKAVDPMALRQAQRAIETADIVALNDDSLIAPYNGDVPAEARTTKGKITRKVRCPSTHLGVPCRKGEGHDGKHSGIERGRNERWTWTDDGSLHSEGA